MQDFDEENDSTEELDFEELIRATSNIKLNDSRSSIIPTDDLSCTYVTEECNVAEIPAHDLHSQLTSSGSQLYHLLDDQLPASYKNSKKQPSANILMVNISIALSKPTKRGEKFVSLPLRVPAQNYFSVRSSWRESIIEDDTYSVGSYERNESSVERIDRRHSLGVEQSPQKRGFHKTQSHGALHYLDSESPTVEQEWHHSEQAVFEYLVSEERIVHDLVQDLIDLGIQPGTEVYAIVLDMHSTRYVCGNCELGMQGMMNPEYEFVQRMTRAFAANNLSYTPEKNMIAHRVTANMPAKNQVKMTKSKLETDSNKRMFGSWQSTLKNRSIFQADKEFSEPDNVPTDVASRTVFVSSNVSDNNTYRSVYRQLARDEYASRIHRGRVLRELSHDPNFSDLPQEHLEAFVELDRISGIPKQDVATASQIYQHRRGMEQEVVRHCRKVQQKLIDIGFEEDEVFALSTRALCAVPDVVLAEDWSIFEGVVSEDIITVDDFFACIKHPAMLCEIIPEIQSNGRDIEDASELLFNKDVQLLLLEAGVSFDELCLFQRLSSYCSIYQELHQLFQRDAELFNTCLNTFIEYLDEDYHSGIEVAMEEKGCTFADLVKICQRAPADLALVCGDITELLLDESPNLTEHQIELGHQYGADFSWIRSQLCFNEKWMLDNRLEDENPRATPVRQQVPGEVMPLAI